MGGQTVEFLAHIGLPDQQGDLLGETLLGKRRCPPHQFGELAVEAGAQDADLCRGPLARAPAQPLDLDDMTVDHRRQRLALGGAGADQRLQHLVELSRDPAVEAASGSSSGGLFLLLDNAAHAQQAIGRRRGGAGALAHLLDKQASSASSGRLMRNGLLCRSSRV